jgi:parallel beta-helix repeat protein
MNAPRVRLILTTLLAAGLVPIRPGTATAATVYVNNASLSCSPGGPGTLVSPYCTITAALAAHHEPGDSIIVLPGTYREQVTAPASGTSGSPITVVGRASAGKPVVVDGADDFGTLASWTLYSGNVWRSAGVNWSPQQVFANNARLASSTVAPALLPANSFSWVSGQGLYVNVGGGNPGGHHLEVGHRQYGFLLAGAEWWVLDGFAVTHHEWAGIELTGATSYISITHDSVTFASQYGIQAEGTTAAVIGSNVASDNLASGIALTSGATGCTVEGNQSYRNLTPTVSAGIYVYGSSGNLLLRNQLHGNAYSGVHVQLSANTRSIQNRSWCNGADGFHAAGTSGMAHVGDVAYRNYRHGFNVDAGSTGASLSGCIAAVNGLVGLGFDLYVDSTATAGLASNDNLLWNPSGRWPVRYRNTSYTSLVDFGAATGHDTRSIQADPRFAEPDSGDFRLTWGSPAIDNANSGVANWPTTDATGAPRHDDPATANKGLGPVTYADRGALEYVSSGTPPAATVPYLDHVIVVIMENQSYTTARTAPYIGALASAWSTFEEFYGIIHPSQPNYFSLWSGSTQGILTDDCPPPGAPFSGENLGHACEAAGLKWKAYSEDLPAVGSPDCTALPTPDGSLYTRKHSPWASFTNLNHANEVPYPQLAADIAAKALPNLAFVIPDNCHNGHNAGCPLSTVDAWLASELPAMISAVGPWGMVVLTWDEDDDVSGDRILTVLAGPPVKTGYLSHRFVNLYTLLRTICDGLGIAPFGAAVTESPITDVWATRTTGVPNPPGGDGTAGSVGPVRPNPFRAATSVSLTLPTATTVSAEVYDLAGRRVKTLAPALLSGAVEIRWDGSRDDGGPARPGVYLVRVRAGGAEFTRRVVRLE